MRNELAAARVNRREDAPAPARVLVVEDEQIVALELKDRLTRMGHLVVGIVASGEEALENIKLLRPDLVLMDIKLQGELDGIEVAQAVRGQVDIPIVYLTAFADDTTLQRAKLTEPYGYILKPFQDRELHAVMEVSLHRYRAERALRKSDVWRFAVLRSLGDAVIAADADGRVKFMNPLAQALTGWKEPEALGKPLEEVFKMVRLIERRTGVWKDITSYSLIAKDGSERSIDAELTPICDANNTPMGIVCVFRDVSARKRLLDRQRLMVTATGEVTSSLDRAIVLTRITSLIARSFADWCTIHLRDACGAIRIAAVAHQHEAKDAAAQECVGATVHDDAAIEVRKVIQRANSMLCSNITNDDWPINALGIQSRLASGLTAASAIVVPLTSYGQCFGALTIVSERRDRLFSKRDIGFMEELGRRVSHGIDNSQTYADARRAARMRGDALAVVSHDLRNPLASISLHADQLLRTPVAPNQERILKNANAIQENAQRMIRLIDDLLDVGRIDSGRLSIELQRHRTTALVSEVFLTFETLASQRSINLVIATLPDLELLCDRERILQVLSNLIGNALEFSPANYDVVISGEVRGAMFQFSVSDRAGGIAADQVAHVFERYWQAPKAVRRGSGLGLYISREIVEAHGGQIGVDVTPGEGSTFYFTIPLAANTPEQDPAP
jgi:PAS domain S-box-containing protein